MKIQDILMRVYLYEECSLPYLAPVIAEVLWVPRWHGTLGFYFKISLQLRTVKCVVISASFCVFAKQRLKTGSFSVFNTSKMLGGISSFHEFGEFQSSPTRKQMVHPSSISFHPPASITWDTHMHNVSWSAAWVFSLRVLQEFFDQKFWISTVIFSGHQKPGSGSGSGFTNKPGPGSGFRWIRICNTY